MKFTVVQTRQKPTSRPQLSVVPTNWVYAEAGTVKFPRSNWVKLSCDPDTLPEENWHTYSCKIIGKCNTREAGNQIIDNYCDKTDSDDATNLTRGTRTTKATKMPKGKFSSRQFTISSVSLLYSPTFIQTHIFIHIPLIFVSVAAANDITGKECDPIDDNSDNQAGYAHKPT